MAARPTNDEGFLDHAYLPSFMHNRKRDYARSFGAQVNYQNRRFAGWAKTMKGFGRAYKTSVKAAYPGFMQFTPYGESWPKRWRTSWFAGSIFTTSIPIERRRRRAASPS